MRALYAILILSAFSRLHAHRPRSLETFKNILDCGLTLGPSKCLNALTTWRLEQAAENSDQTSFKNDLERFAWRKFSNKTDDELYTEACDGAEKLLRRQTLSLNMPGYKLELLSKRNGTLSVDVYKQSSLETGRGSVKKAKKTLLQILPILVVPGLIMSAFLPFILPALKFLTLGAGMLNNMALTGAVFTLLRNNAFNDRYEHKVIYVNQGYKNEHLKHAHIDYANKTNDNYNVHDDDSQLSGYEVQEIQSIEELPFNPNWIKQYYGDRQNVQIVGNGNPIKRFKKSQLNQ